MCKLLPSNYLIKSSTQHSIVLFPKRLSLIKKSKSGAQKWTLIAFWESNKNIGCSGGGGDGLKNELGDLKKDFLFYNKKMWKKKVYLIEKWKTLLWLILFSAPQLLPRWFFSDNHLPWKKKKPTSKGSNKHTFPSFEINASKSHSFFLCFSDHCKVSKYQS